MQPETCKVLCKRTYSDAQLADFAEKIKEHYKVNWIMDNMPAGTKYYVQTKDKKNTGKCWVSYVNLKTSKQISPMKRGTTTQFGSRSHPA